MKPITAKTDYDGVTAPAPATEIHTAEEYNDRRVELEGSVTDSGQSLDVLDTGQLSKAVFANGVAAQSMLDSGGVNTVVLTPITGASGLRVATPLVKDYSLLDGAIFSFKANNTNTGNMTVNVGQTAGALIGAQPLFLEDGTTNVPVGDIVSGTYYNIRYDSSLDVDGAFIIMPGVSKGYVDAKALGSYTSGSLMGITWPLTITNTTPADDISPTQATTDGFLLVTVKATGNNTGATLTVYSDSSASPTIERALVGIYGTNDHIHKGIPATIPVKKGEYFKASFAADGSIGNNVTRRYNWIPFAT